MKLKIFLVNIERGKSTNQLLNKNWDNLQYQVPKWLILGVRTVNCWVGFNRLIYAFQPTWINSTVEHMFLGKTSSKSRLHTLVDPVTTGSMSMSIRSRNEQKPQCLSHIFDKKSHGVHKIIGLVEKNYRKPLILPSKNWMFPVDVTINQHLAWVCLRCCLFSHELYKPSFWDDFFFIFFPGVFLANPSWILDQRVAWR